MIEKEACDVARCSFNDGSSGRLLELPICDHAACAPIRVETSPRVDIAALQTLRALLDARAIGGVALVRLCHSRMLFVHAYPRETQEMAFDAHYRAFALFKALGQIQNGADNRRQGRRKSPRHG